MATHTACQGCLDGCTADAPRHCASCVNEPWPCDASVLRRFLMSAASELHYQRKHPPYGASFLDCDHTICQEHRAALGLPLHGRPVDQAAGRLARANVTLTYLARGVQQVDQTADLPETKQAFQIEEERNQEVTAQADGRPEGE